MTNEEWRTSSDPQWMLIFLHNSGVLTERKARLFAAACCRRIWQLLVDERSRIVVEVAERFAEGLATQEELTEAAKDAMHTSVFNEGMPSHAACVAADAAGNLAPYDSTSGFGFPLLWGAVGIPSSVGMALYYEALKTPVGGVPDDVEDDVPDNPNQAELAARRLFFAEYSRIAAMVRDFFNLRPCGRGNGLAPAVSSLAKEAYDHCVLPEGTLDPARVGVLVDALVDAGCDDAELLEHLRSPGPHFRGCWGVDAVLGKR